jgi:RHS repeat-associated protein
VIYTYDDWKPVFEWDGNGNKEAWNVYGPGADEILWRFQVQVGHTRYHHDARGNVTFVLLAGGQGYARYTYDAFGTPKIMDWNGNVRARSEIYNPFMFQGREYLAELGIYDYRHRYYQPDLGRFLQVDPMGLQTEGSKLSAEQRALFSPGGVAPEAFGSSEMNLFRYCYDDPVDRSDPTGLIISADDETKSMMDGLRNSNDNLRSAIDQLHNSDKVHEFKSAEDEGNSRARGPNGLKGNGSQSKRTFADWLKHMFGLYNKSGSTTYFNPRNNQDAKGVSRDARSQLAHEIGHALDFDNGTTSERLIGKPQISVFEAQGIWWENQANEALGLKTREWNDWGRFGP